VADLEKSLGSVMMSLFWIYYEIRRALKGWIQSIYKRVPFGRKKAEELLFSLLCSLPLLIGAGIKSWR
jgi:hypothetical protein